jgi:hypothetical protein
MKVAYFAESPADQAALTIFTEAILGKKTESVGHAGLRNRSGWPTVRNVLPAVLKQLHYHTDAEGFVFIVDSNGTSPHLSSHEAPNAPDPMCRLCHLRRIASRVLQQVGHRQHQPNLKTAFGLAMPAIEAWLLCGVNPHVTEASWINGMKENQMPFSRPELKLQLYGTSRPSLAIETEAMITAASRLAGNLKDLETLFPHGFGALQADLRRW